MAIQFVCSCGRKLNAPDTAAGRRGRCPACSDVFTVPLPAEEIQPQLENYEIEESGEIPLASPAPVMLRSAPPFAPARQPATKPASPVPAIAPRSMEYSSPRMNSGSTDRGYLYILLLLVLIPLAWSTLQHERNEFSEHLTLTVQNHPELKRKIVEVMSADTVSEEELFAVLPADKLDGALLPKHTWNHWVLALLSGLAFLGLALVLFPLGHARLHHLILIAIFTGTAGIALLLGFQWLAFHMPLFNGRGWITLLLDLIWLIGQSYALAFTNHGFWVSFLGFTAGVGFCEEACKAIPIILKARRTGFINWRAAMLWGLISGVGFGVSEGITYSSDYYNGISGPGIYLVRFISCVGLHAIWAAAVGITIFRRQEIFQDSLHPLEWILRTLQAVIVPMILHGLYDTLLKQKFELYALIVALVSFGWLAWQIEMAKRDFDEKPVEA